MNILWIFLVLQTVLAQFDFGRSYLKKNSRLCHKWSCINTKLGLSDSLPTPEEYAIVLRSLLPADWHNAVDDVLNICYHDRPRRYTNSCPGQAIMHCVVDQLSTRCPEAYLRKEDACAPVNSLAGINNMFTQSRYENIETYIANERRPAWFLRNYFNRICCNLPEMFNSTILSECGFTSFILYNVPSPVVENGFLPPQRRYGTTSTTPANDGDFLHVASISDLQDETSQLTSTDPLDCCDISDLIQPSWRQECNFGLEWAGQKRLVIKHDAPDPTTTTVPTSTSSAVTRTDVSIVPQTCEQETCVFNKLNIISATGEVNVDAFIKLLDNFTIAQPTWNSAKGRVVTTCLRKPVTEYSAQCEINKILACTFDVLTENCPNATKSDPCKHHQSSQRTCQISSSKYKPKQRREICPLPELVNKEILAECGITSLGKMEPVVTVTKPKTYRLFTSMNKCQDLTPSTNCLLTKMEVSNKYGFMDYFKMTNRIRTFTSNKDWSDMKLIFMNAFYSGPLYKEYCNSAKRFLNVLDSVLLTCPDSRKKNTAQCASIFREIKNTAPKDVNDPALDRTHLLNYYYDVFNFTKQNSKVVGPKHIRKIKKRPIYNYGFLNYGNAPKVVTIDVKPKVEKKPLVEKPPLVLLPVYMRVPQSNLLIKRPFNENGVMRGIFSSHNQIVQAPISTASPISTTQHLPVEQPLILSPMYMEVPHSNLLLRPFNQNGIMRNSFALHNKIAQAHITTASPIFTSSSSPSKPISTNQPISTKYRVSTDFDSQFEMLKPE